jgi:hypothetical protein
MVADIAIAERAKDRIGQRMKSDIGIAMTLKSMTMRNFYPADPHRLVDYKAVNIIAHADCGACHRLDPQQP